MNYKPETIQLLDTFAPTSWEGIGFRHMFATIPPDRENTRGARWNPPETPAIYTSLTRETVIAEADYQINLQPLRPKAQRKIYRISIALESVIDLTDWNALSKFHIGTESFQDGRFDDCQEVGGAVEWLGHDGLLIPSARAKGINLVIFPNRKTPNYKFEIVDYEEL